MVDFEKIKELRGELNELLAECPELIPIQDEINRELALCGNDKQRRNAKIQELMLNSWFRITTLGEEDDITKQ